MLRINQRLLRHFGIERLGQYTDDVIEMISQEMTDAVRTGDMAALVGPYGSGKTTIFDRVKARVSSDVQWVSVRDMTPSASTLQNVINAVIYDLDEDASLRRDFEARSRQAERLLYQAERSGKHACVVIDDAHRLTMDSLSGLKMLREAEFNGQRLKISIVLIGWEKLGNRLNARKDIAWRTTRFTLSESEGYMTVPKRVDFLESVFGPAIAPETRETIAILQDRPAGLVATAHQAMQDAALAGYDVVDGRTVSPTMKQQRDALGVSLREIEQETREMGHRVSHTTVQRRIESPKNDEETEAVQAALDRIQARKSQPMKKTA